MSRRSLLVNIIFDILAEDESGISELYILFNGSIFYDNDGDHQILIENPRIPGIYNFTIIISCLKI